MPEEATCGRGLAANATLPAELADVVGRVADVLDTHTKALDLDDDNARQEHDAYVKLVEQHRRAAADLRSISAQMASYRDLPMGRHDAEELASPEAAAVFERLVNAERELRSLLEERQKQHQPLLDELRAGSGR